MVITQITVVMVIFLGIVRILNIGILTFRGRKISISLKKELTIIV